MDIIKLRKELDEITSDNDIFTHKAKIENLCKQFNCSIEVSEDYDPTRREIFHCFEYALSLYPNVHQSILLNVQELVRPNSNGYDSEGPPLGQFLEYLVQKGYISEKEQSVLANNDLVIYFRNSKSRHAGLWKNGRVTSKWGKGLLYNHEILELPLSYGDPKYFNGIETDLAKKQFLEYARGKGVPDYILAD